jgi:hypothetical protein
MSIKANALGIMLAALLTGSVAGDPIDRLSAWLTTPSNSPFPNGPWQPISLPVTADTKQLAFAALAPKDTSGFNILKTRKLRLAAKGMEGLGDPNYMAVLVNTRSGLKIVLLQYDVNVWISRVYDTKNLPNPQGGANGRQPINSETNRASEAAASRRSP